jgi:hypothetical protein
VQSVIDANKCLKWHHIFCGCEALALLRFRHLGHNFFRPGDIADISVSKVLHFVLSVGCQMLKQRVARKIGKRRSARITVMPVYSALCYVSSDIQS